MIVAASAPLRIDLTGGYTDVPEIYDYMSGVAINAAISYRTVVGVALDDAAGQAARTYRSRPSSDIYAERLLFHVGRLLSMETPQAVSVHSEGPRGCGLGSSASLAVAMTALVAPDLTNAEIVEIARHAEIAAGNQCGVQDELAAVYGGVVATVFPTGGPYVSRTLESDRTGSVERQCSLWLREAARSSGTHVEQVLNMFRIGDPQTLEALNRLNAAYPTILNALDDGDARRLIRAVREVYAAQVALPYHVVPNEVQRLVKVIEERLEGAAKVEGGGGPGAALLVLAPDEMTGDLGTIMAARGYRNLGLTFERRGVALYQERRNEDGGRDDYLRA